LAKVGLDRLAAKDRTAMALAMGRAMTVLARQTVQALVQAVANDAKPLDALKDSPHPNPFRQCAVGGVKGHLSNKK
jgi:hypothetical protein